MPKSFREEFAVAADFLARGLDKRRQCVFVADDNGPDVVRMALRSRGLRVDDLARDGRLSVVAGRDTPLGAAGPLDAASLYRAWAEMTDRAVARGYSGLSVAVEMTWALDHDAEALALYERGAAPLFESKPLDALCLYNWNVFQEKTILVAAVRSHSRFVVDGAARPPASPEEFGRVLELAP